jgi:nicotinamide riboside kinase
MATLHFICGKAGAGKTTLARELGRTLPAVVFVEDEWIDTLGFEIKSLNPGVYRPQPHNLRSDSRHRLWPGRREPACDPQRRREKIQLYLEYDPEPPFQAGSPDTAPQEVRDEFTQYVQGMLDRRRQAVAQAAAKL